MESIDDLNNIIRQDVTELLLIQPPCSEENSIIFNYFKGHGAIKFYCLTDRGGFVYIIDNYKYHHKLIQLTEDNGNYFINDDEYSYFYGNDIQFVNNLTKFLTYVQSSIAELKFKGEF